MDCSLIIFCSYNKVSGESNDVNQENVRLQQQKLVVVVVSQQTTLKLFSIFIGFSFFLILATFSITAVFDVMTF